MNQNVKIPTFPSVHTNVQLIQDDVFQEGGTPVKYWHIKMVTKVRLLHEGKYYKTVVMERAKFSEDQLNNAILMVTNKFIENCYSMILLGKVNPNFEVYEIDDDPNLGHLSDKEIIDLTHKVRKAQYDAWMNNIQRGEGDARGEFVPSIKQIIEKLGFDPLL